MRLALIVSQFNEEITQGLLKGARDHLDQNGYLEHYDIYSAPGAFEIPILAQALARSKKYAGIICLGCVIKGETAHFEHISSSCATGIMQTMLTYQIPVTFGVLTTYTDEQALERSQPNSNNKGKEAASACLEVLSALALIL